ncbi:hypothetical protein K8I31_15260 [bacterium]|nr:hypothetical protein [bacterium]
MASREVLPQLIPQTPRRKSRRLFIWAVVFLAAVFSIWILHPVETFINYILVYETPVEPVDALFITQLGETKTAAEWFHNGNAKRILILRGPKPEYRNTDPLISAHTFIRDELLKELVPSHAIANLPYEATNSVDGHRLVREWVFANHVKSIAEFPPKYISYFEKLKHEKTLGLEGVKLIMKPVDPNGIWRKQILAIENMLMRMAWWEFVELPKLQTEFGYDKVAETQIQETSA